MERNDGNFGCLKEMLDAHDIALLNRAQLGLPVERKPFDVLGEELQMSEEEVLERLKRLKRIGIVRSVSASFDASRLGYRSALVAFSVESKHLTDVASVISSLPFVSHNYERDAEFNLWFTITLPSETDMEAEVVKLALECNVHKWLFLPTLRTFKIGVALDASLRFGNIFEKSDEPPMPKRDLAEDDITCIRILQEELPLTSTPFDELAKAHGKNGEWLIERAKILLSEGRLRRVAVFVNHKRLGYNANALVVWSVPNEEVEKVGKALAAVKQVSHCYHRPAYPEWQFSVYTMFHSVDEKSLQKAVEEAASIVGDYKWRMLLSVREFKKARVKFFA